MDDEKTRLQFSTAYNPQTDGETEVVKPKSVTIITMSCSLSHHEDLVLTMAEFAYNNLVNRSTGMSQFKAVTSVMSHVFYVLYFILFEVYM